jgi:hypothetical protein
MQLSVLRRFLTSIVVGGALATIMVSCAGSLRTPPLGPPDLTQPIDRLTAARLASLSRDDAMCRAILQNGLVAHSLLPPLQSGQCGYSLAVRLKPEGPAAIAFRPDSPGMSCPVAAALHLWMRDVVQPAAQAHFGSRVTAIDHFGTYSCRRTYGREAGDWSEHARANAIDIAGFRLASGRQVSVVRHWAGTPQEQAFLREVRDGACRLFATTLSPDYNEAHRDHFHLDMAQRGTRLFGGFCR